MSLLKQVLNLVQGAVVVEADEVAVINEVLLQEHIDEWVKLAVFGEGLERDLARSLIWESGQELGIYASSIHELYMAIGTGQVPSDFTVPAINIRGMNFNMSRAIFRAANNLNAGAILCEIARSEIGYTSQRPAEYISSVIGAAIKEGYRGPVFIQGDHFQISLKGYTKNPTKEVQAVKDLMKEAIEAGFYNIDIDTSTLVDLSYDELDEQQRVNYELCAELTAYTRELEPEGITVSLGGEIGEVGGHNSTVEELHAFMQGYQRVLSSIHPDLQGISKISVQTGTSHGGVVLPDGTLAQVKVDFETLGELGRISRDTYGLGGAVQHGASTLPSEAFGKFPQVGTVEIHLATGFQNLIYDNAPQEVVDASYDYILQHHAHEWKTSQTEEQFLYKTRKKAFGPLKAQWWAIDKAVMSQIGEVLQAQFEFLFNQLNIVNTLDVVRNTVTCVRQRRALPVVAQQETILEIASDLAD